MGQKPSEEIMQIVKETQFDYRTPCGANNCECYENSVKIEAILQWIDDNIFPDKD